jgi:hypothetical protein
LDFPHLSVDSLLPLNAGALLDVAFHTFSSRTGWGRRQLNRKEIAGAMDLPLWFSTSPLIEAWFRRHELGVCMPLKPFQTLMGMFFKSASKGSDSSLALSSRTKRPPTVVSDDFWIASLSRSLPGTWVNSGVISDKAAKADDATIHTGLWDQRVVLVFPQLSVLELEMFRNRVKAVENVILSLNLCAFYL